MACVSKLLNEAVVACVGCNQKANHAHGEQVGEERSVRDIPTDSDVHG